MNVNRRYDIDALRVLAFGILILYHCGMLFVPGWGWHIKSSYQVEALPSIMQFFNAWRMPLLFLVSGFKKIIDQYPNIKSSSVDYDDFNSPNSKYLKLLTSNPNIDYVFSFNDIIAYKAWEITKKRFPNNRIKFIGVDGLNGPNGGLQLVKDGVLSGTVLYPTGGSEAIKLALKIINKEIVPKNNKLNTTMIDSLNADMMSSQFDKITIQQSNIEQQQNIIKNQEIKYSTQNNLLKLLFFLFLIVLGLALFSVYSRIIISRKKQELETKNLKIKNQRNQIKSYSEELKLSNEARLNFFTGLSHEFKTPLTLILSSVESLETEFKNKGISVTKEINLMYNNSRRLLRLINQLLDYRKMEDQKFTLRASKTNILDFSKSIISDFDREAKKKNIDFSLTTTNPDLEVYLDRNLMDKVYFNLFVQIAVFDAQYAAELHPEERFEIFLPSVKQSSKINST